MKKRRLQNLGLNNKAVSEVLGSILLLSISISLFSVIYLSLFAIQVQPSTPSVNIIGTIESDMLYLEHYGGKPLSLGTEIMLDFNLDGNNSISLTIDEANYLEDSEKQDGKWNIGEDFCLDLNNISGYKKYNPVGVTVIDIVSNSVVMSGILQEIMKQSSADLGISSLICLPSTVSNTGEDINVSFTVCNYGLNSSNGFEYHIYIDGIEATNGSKDFDSPLKPGCESKTITTPVTLPSNQPSNGGSYNITVEITVLGTIYESDGDSNTENNYDTFYVSLNPVAPKADLQITLGSSDYNPGFGTLVTITTQVTNNGPGSSDNVNTRLKFSPGLTYISHSQTKGSYSPGEWKWNINSLNLGETAQLDIEVRIDAIPEEIEFTQLCIILDGSYSVDDDTFKMMIEGVASAVRNNSIPNNGRIELTVIQFGVEEPYPYPYTPAVVEVGPVVLTNTNYITIANKIESITKLGGYSPLCSAMMLAADTLKASPNYSPNNRQVINFITDGYPTLKPYQKFPSVSSNCYELEDGRVVCIDSDSPEPDISFQLDEPDIDILYDISIYRNYVIETLEMTEDQDEINGLIVNGVYGNNLNWFRDNVVYPQPGYDNWPPTGPGWVRLVDNSNKVIESLEQEIHYIPVGREIFSWVTSDTPDPNIYNNEYKIVITPASN